MSSLNTSSKELIDQPVTLKIRNFSEWQWCPATFVRSDTQSRTVKLVVPTTATSDSDSTTDLSEKTVGDGRDIEPKVYDVPTSIGGPEYFRHRPQDGQRKLLIVMVGLPARGKTFLAQKLCRLLGWHGYRSQVFNIQVSWKERMQRHFRRSHKRTVSGGGGGNNGGGLASSGFSVTPQGKSPDMVPNASSGDLGIAEKSPDLSSDATVATPVTPTPAQVFAQYLCDPESNERRIYLQSLQEHRRIAEAFFNDGGLVSILNDDFPTASLREDAEKMFAPLVDNVIYLEVQRDPECNTSFDVLKVQDEYASHKNMSGDAMMADFQARVQLMQSVYETMTPKSGKNYIRLLNSQVLEAHGVHGFLPSRIVSFLMNLSQMKVSHPIYFCRHGQSEYNLEDRLGGDPNLTEKGRNDAEALYEFIASLKEDLEGGNSPHQNRHNRQPLLRRIASAADDDSTPITPAEDDTREAEEAAQERLQQQLVSIPESTALPTPPNTPLGGTDMCKRGFDARRAMQNQDMQIWTSQLRRAIQTAAPSQRRLDIKTLRWSSLNEIHAGVCENLTYAEVKEQYPLIHRFRGEDKYAFRYPQGESYQDLVARLEPVIMELENANRVVVVVAHQAVLRGLLAYFGSTSAESSVNVEVPHRTVWRCSFSPKGTAQVHQVKLGKAAAGDGQQD